MFMKINLSWCFLVTIFCYNFVDCELELQITSGKIKGKILKSRDGRSYYSYTGIPYAKPPIGELRFKAPKPVEPWNGTLDVTQEPNICIQQGYKNGLEDCLYLNVYSPKTDKKLLPIMFWIHGGGFTVGNSRFNQYGPDYFMDKDVVLVTINYRLGILGFLSTEDDVIPGNYGMKDQVEALRWVKQNIDRFNGNPNQVTIFGESAGGASTGFHMLSPMSKGLFHKAILESGSPMCKWAISPPGLARERAHVVADIAGCQSDTSKNILKCLQKLPAIYLMDLHPRLYSWLIFPLILFNPVVENCTSSQNAFLCHHPIYDFKQESFVPAIVGMNSAEGGLHTAFLYNKTTLAYPEFQTDFNRLFSILTDYNHYTNPDNIDEIGQKVLKKYFPTGRLDENSHLKAVKMFTDSFFAQCVLDMAYNLSSPVYSYIYDYQNEFSFNKVFGTCEKPLGVTHSDELNSLFKMNAFNIKDLNEKDLEVSRLAVNIWYKFATTDKPTIDGSENGVAWQRFTRSNQYMMSLNSTHPVHIKNPFLENYDFWNSLPFYSKQEYLEKIKN